MKKIKYLVILIIFLISLASSIILSFIPIDQACGLDQQGCYKVQTSNYEKTLGINNSYLGVIAFAILSILTIWYLKKPKKILKNLIYLGIAISFIFSLYFIYLQIFIIKALCRYCMAIDIGAILNFGIILFWRKK